MAQKDRFCSQNQIDVVGVVAKGRFQDLAHLLRFAENASFQKRFLVSVPSQS
jgi:hypothetical protein